MTTNKLASRTFWWLFLLSAYLCIVAWVRQWGAADCVLALGLPVGAWMGGKYSEARERRLAKENGNGGNP